MKFVMKRDRWTLDLAVMLIFGVAAAAWFQIVSDDGAKHYDRILFAIGIAILAYLITFVMGLAIKRFSFVRSWVWMAMVGALVYEIAFLIRTMPIWLDNYRVLKARSGISFSEYFLPFLSSAVGFYFFWMIPGALFLVAVRYATAFLETYREKHS